MYGGAWGTPRSSHSPRRSRPTRSVPGRTRCRVSWRDPPGPFPGPVSRPRSPPPAVPSGGRRRPGRPRPLWFTSHSDHGEPRRPHVRRRIHRRSGRFETTSRPIR